MQKLEKLTFAIPSLEISESQKLKLVETINKGLEVCELFNLHFISVFTRDFVGKNKLAFSKEFAELLKLKKLEIRDYLDWNGYSNIVKDDDEFDILIEYLFENIENLSINLTAQSSSYYTFPTYYDEVEKKYRAGITIPSIIARFYQSKKGDSESLRIKYRKKMVDAILKGSTLVSRLLSQDIEIIRRDALENGDASTASSLLDSGSLTKEQISLILFNPKVGRDKKVEILKKNYLQKDFHFYLKKIISDSNFDVADILIEETIEKNGRIKDKVRSKMEVIQRLICPSEYKTTSVAIHKKIRMNKNPSLLVFVNKYKKFISENLDVLVSILKKKYDYSSYNTNLFSLILVCNDYDISKFLEASNKLSKDNSDIDKKEILAFLHHKYSPKDTLKYLFENEDDNSENIKIILDFCKTFENLCEHYGNYDILDIFAKKFPALVRSGEMAELLNRTFDLQKFTMRNLVIYRSNSQFSREQCVTNIFNNEEFLKIAISNSHYLKLNLCDYYKNFGLDIDTKFDNKNFSIAYVSLFAKEMCVNETAKSFLFNHIFEFLINAETGNRFFEHLNNLSNIKKSIDTRYMDRYEKERIDSFIAANSIQVSIEAFIRALFYELEQIGKQYFPEYFKEYLDEFNEKKEAIELLCSF